jgi:hypothetical protein
VDEIRIEKVGDSQENLIEISEWTALIWMLSVCSDVEVQ